MYIRMSIEVVKDSIKFFELVNTTDKQYLFIDAFQTWCAPCKKLDPDLEKLAQKYGKNIHFVKVDCADCDEFVKKYGITKFPTLFYLKAGDNELPINSQKIIGPKLLDIEKLLIKLNGGGIVISDDF